MRDFCLSSFRAFAVLLTLCIGIGSATTAQSKPLSIASGALAEELFQTYIVASILKKAGFAVSDDIKSLSYDIAHVALSNGDVDVLTTCTGSRCIRIST